VGAELAFFLLGHMPFWFERRRRARRVPETETSIAR
jgi:hypothetical protein